MVRLTGLKLLLLFLWISSPLESECNQYNLMEAMKRYRVAGSRWSETVSGVMLFSSVVQNTIFGIKKTGHCLSKSRNAFRGHYLHNEPSELIISTPSDHKTKRHLISPEWTKPLICVIGLWQTCRDWCNAPEPTGQTCRSDLNEAEWPLQHKFNSHQLLTPAYELCLLAGTAIIVCVQDAAHTLAVQK